MWGCMCVGVLSCSPTASSPALSPRDRAPETLSGPGGGGGRPAQLPAEGEHQAVPADQDARRCPLPSRRGLPGPGQVREELLPRGRTELPPVVWGSSLPATSL